MRRSTLLPTLLALPFLAACGGGGDGGGGGGGTAAASSDPCASDAVVVHMKNIKFDPAQAKAKAGDKVCWVNDDDVQHDVSAEKGATFKSALYGKDMTFTTTVSDAGTIEYVCTVHPSMTATLEVTP
jgi:plastocyanin